MGRWGWLVHPDERRLRAPWRLGTWVLALGLFALPVAVAVTLLGDRLGWPSLPVLLGLQCVATVPATLMVARWIDRRPLSGIGLRRPARFGAHALVGAAVGAGLIAGVALLEHSLGWARYAELTFDPVALWPSALAFVAVAIDEEVLFRSYLLTNLAEAWGGRARVRGVVLATLASSLVFGAAHLGNPDATPMGILNVTLAGGLLAMPYVITREVGLSMGVHFGWNLAQAWLGMAVSGNDLSGALATRTLTPGAELWTGGAFGAEGGLLGLGAIALGTLVVAGIARAVRDEDHAAGLGDAPFVETPHEASHAAPHGARRPPSTPAATPLVAPIELGLEPHPEDRIETGHAGREAPGPKD